MRINFVRHLIYIKHLEHSFFLLRSCLCALLCVLPIAAKADLSSMDMDQLLSQLENEDLFLNEIVITATKREDTLTQVPVSVAVIGSDDIDRADFEDFRSITYFNPSLNYSSAQSTANTTTLSLRGVGTEGNQIGFDSSVGIFIDGVYQSRPGIALTEYVDVAQIELMRGPQGTLFGRNTSVGALSIRSNLPDPSATGLSWSQTFGNYDLRLTNGVLNLPVAESLALRFSTAIRQRDGWLENNNPGAGSEHNRDRSYFRAQALWQPVDSNFSARLIIDEAESDEDCCVPVQLEPFNQVNLAVRGLTLGDVGHEAALGLDNPETNSTGRFEKTTQRGASLEFIWNISDDLELTYLPAWRDYEAIAWGDLTGDSIAFADTLETQADQINIETQTHELRLNGLIFDDRVDWLLGGFYIKEDVSELVQRIAGAGFDPLVESWRPLLGATTETIASPVGGGTSNFLGQQTESVSVFSHNIIKLSDAFDLTLGVRFVEESRRGGLLSSTAIGNNSACADNRAALGAAQAGGGASPFLATATILSCNPVITPVADDDSGAIRSGIDPTASLSLFDAEFDDSSLTYLASLSAAINANNSAYASYSKGFKSGGINLEFTGGGSFRPTYRSEQIESYELGIKSQLFNRTLQNNLALFYMDIKDFQLGVLPAFSFEIFNVAKAASYGLEFESDWRANETIRWGNSVAYTRAEFDDDCAGDLTGMDAMFVEAQCGYDLPKSSRIKATTRLDITVPFAESKQVLVSPSIRHVGRYQPFAGQPDYKQPSINFIDLSVTFLDKEDNWQLAAWVNNLTDKQQVLTAFNAISAGFIGDNNATAGFITEPRTYGATFLYSFFGAK